MNRVDPVKCIRCSAANEEMVRVGQSTEDLGEGRSRTTFYYMCEDCVDEFENARRGGASGELAPD